MANALMLLFSYKFLIPAPGTRTYGILDAIKSLAFPKILPGHNLIMDIISSAIRFIEVNIDVRTAEKCRRYYY